MAYSANHRPITEQIDQLKAKIALLEGDRKAFYQTAIYTEKKNDEEIANLRKQNKELRKELADRLAADDHVINKALLDHSTERKMLANKTGPEAITLLDYRLCDTIKKLNGMQADTRMRERRLEELEARHESLVADQKAAEATDVGESEAGRRLRSLENRYDKAQLKCTEAERIKQTYEQIKSKLEEEHLQFENILRDLEMDIGRSKDELKELRRMNADAQLSRERAVKELRRQEEEHFTERKKREQELTRVRREAEEKRALYERTERRLQQRAASGSDDGQERKQTTLSSNGGLASGNSGPNSGEEAQNEQQRRIATYEEAFLHIKNATGVSDIKELVLRFENQDTTRDRLKEMSEANVEKLKRLEEEREKLEHEMERLKYSGEAKLSSGQRVLEEFEEHLAKEEHRLKNAREKLNKESKLLIAVKSGVEQLYEKLQVIKLEQSHVPASRVPPTSDEYVLDLVSRCEERLLKLLEDLRAQQGDTNALLKQLEEEEFRAKMETNLPQYNVRVKLPGIKKEGRFEEEEEQAADEEDAEVPSRGAIKKQSQQLIESKTKRRVAKKKKKGKNN